MPRGWALRSRHPPINIPLVGRIRIAPRYLVFDVIKIIACIMVLIWHTQLWLTNYDYFIPVIGQVGLGRLAVYTFFITSGALVEITYKDKPYLRYVFDKVVRLYPAYWLTLLVYFWFPIARIGLWNWIGQLLAVNMLLGTPLMNGPAWYLCTLLIMYMAYPFLRKYNGVGLLFVYVLLREVLILLGLGGVLYYYYSPLATLSLFLLGAYMANNKWYPMWQSNKTISFLANLSFYVYIVHWLPIVVVFPYHPIVYFGLIGVGALVLMVVDCRIQSVVPQTISMLTS